MLRIDVSSVSVPAGESASSRAAIDTALRVAYSPDSIRHLLVTTSNNKLLKFDATNGRMITAVSCVEAYIFVDLFVIKLSSEKNCVKLSDITYFLVIL